MLSRLQGRQTQKHRPNKPYIHRGRGCSNTKFMTEVENTLDRSHMYNYLYIYIYGITDGIIITCMCPCMPLPTSS